MIAKFARLEFERITKPSKTKIYTSFSTLIYVLEKILPFLVKLSLENKIFWLSRKPK